MIGDLLKSASRVALVAVASISLSGAAAQAADLGGNCCADLEERVAELEATTARKGNRKVSLTVYGQVNHAVIFWNDGVESNQYVVDNNSARSRFGFRGAAKITSDVSAGYLLEIGVRYANSGNRNATATGAGGNTNTLDIRHSAWYLDSKSLGRVWVGKTSSATDGITEINLANVNSGGFDYSAWNAGFGIRGGATANGQSGTRWGQAGNQGMGANAIGEGDRTNLVRYVSPTFAGFIASASWGEDDRRDVSLRYAGEFSGIRLAAGIGYQQLTDTNNGDGNGGCRNIGGIAAVSNVNCEAIGLSASVMHMATGLFVTGAYGQQKDNNVPATVAGVAVNGKGKGYYLQAGIEQKWSSLGKTTVFGEYSHQSNGAQFGGADALATFGVLPVIASEVQFFGVGLNQSIDAAAADFYIHYRAFAAGVTVVGPAAAVAALQAPQNFQAVMTGMVIRF